MVRVSLVVRPRPPSTRANSEWTTQRKKESGRLWLARKFGQGNRAISIQARRRSPVAEVKVVTVEC